MKCDGCGRFIKPEDVASSKFIPDSDYSREEELFHCKSCFEKYGRPASTQQFWPQS